jgi:hypothetical protein
MSAEIRVTEDDSLTSSSLPIMVCVFPDPVWPYEKIVPL